MKNILLLSSLFLISELASAACLSPISRPQFSSLQVLRSTDLNNQFNTVYSHVNALPGDCVTDESITAAKIKDGVITNAEISDSAAIARTKLASVNWVKSASSGVFNTSSLTAVDVTNLSVTITTTGGPVELFLVADNINTGSIGPSVASGTSYGGFIKLIRDSASIGTYDVSISGATSTAPALSIASSTVRFFDSPPAGTYTYKIQAYASASPQVMRVYNTQLVANEL